MPASTTRARQPVTELAKAVANILKVPIFDEMLVKLPPEPGAKPAKDLVGKEAKAAALKGRLDLKEIITNEGKWNALLIDDLFDSGASMEAATAKLREYSKVGKVYAAALTWK
jgi:predicted amidophosphoribosyltransferase